jgi:Zn(II)-responsive transcriptional regulator
MPTMTVGKLAEATGINIETVRFYEREGLMPKPERTQGGHRLFDDTDVARLRFIQRAKEVGFTLKEIQDLLFLRDSEVATCEDVCEMAKRKVAEIERKIEMLTEMRDHLKALTEICPGDSRPTECCSILKGLEGGAAPAKRKGKSR